MDIKINKFKAALKEGKVQYGLFSGIPDTYVGEIVAGAGFDWVMLDNEHGPYDHRTTLLQIQAMAAHNTSVVVRPPTGDPVLIKQLLDAGAQSILVPMVESKTQTELMVRAMQYPPKGIRGVGTALARAAQWNRVDNYFQKADEQMCLFVQVESVAGYEALEEILEVEELDGVFIGPADLAGSMGLIGQPMHPSVIEKVSQGLEKIKAAGKFGGVIAVRDDIVENYKQAGAQMIGLGVDLILLAKATAALANKFTGKQSKEGASY